MNVAWNNTPKLLIVNFLFHCMPEVLLAAYLVSYTSQVKSSSTPLGASLINVFLLPQRIYHHTHTPSPSPSLITHTHYLSLFLSNTHTPSPSLITHTHTISLSFSLTHTHTNVHHPAIPRLLMQKILVLLKVTIGKEFGQRIIMTAEK